ncbi:hypothetical protein Syun_020052 [Stephania yunnanensis]|uniref:DNA mismatch repair proteins mutS family domain-containing protein n=1 Tax=Stephania yunnanensis TaxID=152371 RepID=A0AAP0IVZ0_9MAGN
MASSASLIFNPIKIFSATPSCSVRFRIIKTKAALKALESNSNDLAQTKSTIHRDSLRVLEWEKVCDCVASFAGTSLGKEALKEQLWFLNRSYEESKSLLVETSAAVEIFKFGGCGMEFKAIDVELVKSAIGHASRGLPVEGSEALAVASLLQLSQALQSNLRAAFKEDTDSYNRFMPLTEWIMDLITNQALVNSIEQVVDEDGCVKDSASSNLKRYRDQMRTLETKLFQLLDNTIRNEIDGSSSMEVGNIDGRWCIKSRFDQITSINGLLMSSGSGVGSLVEPFAAIPLNNELQQAKALVAKAEEEVLLKLTEKIQTNLDGIELLLKTIIRLDVVVARAKYSLQFGGTYPDLFLTEDDAGVLTVKSCSPSSGTSKVNLSYQTQREWALYLPKAYHPLLLQQHRQNMQQAKKDITNARAEIRRRKVQGEAMDSKGNSDADLRFLEMKVSKLKESYPIPVDFFIGSRTRVLVITGPNTGGKTICLKTVGLAAMMAKSGLYVLSAEPVRIPWFDSIFADIGDEQSLSQSLSTFSGHLRQISAIQARSTSKSLVLLDEVGAGTNPLEGAALGMSVLESFAESGACLTIATTHHGELKTLKYSNDAFENACMEFDEANLKPTYKILWGIPGRSNAINIANRLGLPKIIIDDALVLYGTASSEINEVIVDMERFKQDLGEHVVEAQNYLNMSRGLYEKLLHVKQKIEENRITQRYKMMKELSEASAMARSLLHQRLRQARALAVERSQNTEKLSNIHTIAKSKQQAAQAAPASPANHSKFKVEKPPSSEKPVQIPKISDLVYISSLATKATVLKVEASKNEITVQARNMKLKLKLSDIQR